MVKEKRTDRDFRARPTRFVWVSFRRAIGFRRLICVPGASCNGYARIVPVVTFERNAFRKRFSTRASRARCAHHTHTHTHTLQSTRVHQQAGSQAFIPAVRHILWACQFPVVSGPRLANESVRARRLDKEKEERENERMRERERESERKLSKETATAFSPRTLAVGSSYYAYLTAGLSAQIVICKRVVGSPNAVVVVVVVVGVVAARVNQLSRGAAYGTVVVYGRKNAEPRSVCRAYTTCTHTHTYIRPRV